jgi:hypothetical protein
MGGRTFRVALACCRSAVRGSWRQAAALALVAGLLGGVALGAVAGARRTATAYGRYLTSINASDVFVNVPGWLPGMPATRPYQLISSLPGVVAHTAYIGLSGQPVVHGKPDNSFLVDSLNGSLDGEYFSQDRATVLAGRLPAPGSTSTVVLTPTIAKAFGTGVGGTVSYLFQRVDAQQKPAGKPFTRSFLVAAIVTVPPALTDESDQQEGSIFPPGATRQLLPEYLYTRSALLGSVAAVIAVVTAVVFSASLSGLSTHSARYGWDWDLVIQAEAGYGAFAPGVMNKLIQDEPAVTGWSEFAFTQLPVDNRVIPALGLQRQLGLVQPPTTSGRALSAPDQIELGTVTLRELGKKIGDRVRIGIAPYAQTVVITGTVTLPSFGVGAADHPGLGRGAMVPEATLQAAMGQAAGRPGPAGRAARYRGGADAARDRPARRVAQAPSS